ncbi:glycosyltransferase family 4 protein [Parathalassolituus penaei]|uniref:Glycosyltransferase family 4 protein n=1 Tax=Parathalassolituus penaei TaxID=2997323 RepID=A0A9X3EG70_9GAMM|nr:glycosyltransferase family 4 protein [Parathalassolituus penaei]MCY0966942.1 glycosyltransferase family 4 protein [Parathalassolituus penaei]
MKVNIAVCGKYHLLNYALSKDFESLLGRLYLSSIKGVDDNRAVNDRMKQILVQLHGKIPFRFGYEKSIVWYHDMWQKSMLRRWESCDILHVISHGASLDMIKKAKDEGSKIILEAVNTHPVNRFNVVNKQASYFGLPLRQDLYPREYLAIEEASLSDSLLAPTNIVSESYAETMAFKSSYVLPYCANTKKFSAGVFRNESRVKVLCVGQIGLRKGQLHLLEALDILDSRVEVTLVGMIDSNVRKIVKKFSGRFLHVERVPGAEMPEFMRGFDIFILPSLEEGLSLSILEAMASGLAVIGSKASGAGEIIDGNNGLVIDTVNAESIAGAVNTLVESDARLLMRNLAISSVQDTMNWVAYSNKLKEIYNESEEWV